MKFSNLDGRTRRGFGKGAAKGPGRVGWTVGAWGIELFCRAGNVAKVCRIFRPGRVLDVIVPLSFLFRPLRSGLLNSAKMVAQYDKWVSAEFHDDMRKRRPSVRCGLVDDKILGSLRGSTERCTHELLWAV